MNVQRAILIGLFALVLIASGGVYWPAESGNSFQIVVNLGVVVGVIGVIVGFEGDGE